jgi:hypothetical protein
MPPSAHPNSVPCPQPLSGTISRHVPCDILGHDLPTRNRSAAELPFGFAH